MNYPTTEQIERAGREQLGRWCKFLPSPGNCAIGASDANFEKRLDDEIDKLDKIIIRFLSLGGMNSSLSKRIGWVK